MEEKKKNLHVAVSGNIGSGKTTLTGLLSKHYGWESHYEDVDGNPYINDFYAEMQRWSFNMQIYYLNNRFNQILEIREGKKVLFKIEQFMRMPSFLRQTYIQWV